MDVAQVGVRTKGGARALDMAVTESSEVKKRKLGDGELEFSSSLVQLKSRRQVPLNSTASNDQYSSPSSDHLPASCCSRDESTDVSVEKLNFADLGEEQSIEIETSACNVYCTGRRETTTAMSKPESKARPSEEANSGRQSTAGKMPSEAELEEFFAVAEKNLQKQFADKYNYDIAKDKPLEGRYEWVELKQ